MERSIIAGLFEPTVNDADISSIKSELESLLRSAGGISLNFFYQKRNVKKRKFLLGKGKVEEIKIYIENKNIQLVLIYNHLTNVQQRNLENFFKIKVVDRTRLILDVFALGASTNKGKLQVELAQLLYILPKLKGKGTELSRLGGGIGTRGPGESKLETDRRKLSKRISVIKKRLKKLNLSRNHFRIKKNSSFVPLVSLAGYTSAGKSTLFNALTDEDTYVTSKMFATLDPLVRRLNFPVPHTGYFSFLTDTVGFISNMPEELMEAFKSTLEEISEADLVLNVIDVSDKNFMRKKRDVENIFLLLKIHKNKIINIYNKIDLLDPFEKDVGYLSGEKSVSVLISAKEGIGIDILKDKIFNKLFSEYKRFRLKIDPEKTEIWNISSWAFVTKRSRRDNHIYLEILTTHEKMLKFVSEHLEVFYEVLT